MNNEQDKLVGLLCRYAAGKKLTKKQKYDLRTWISRSHNPLNRSLQPQYLRDLAKAEQEKAASWVRFKNKYEAIIDFDAPPAPGKVLVYTRLVMKVAAVLIPALLVVYLLVKHYPAKQNSLVAATAPKNDIGPGGFKATLKLGDGSEMILDPDKTGIIALQGNTQINQSTKGRLVYQTKAVAGTPQVVTNELIAPRAGKYQVVLPDGSLVLLNAASSLRYSTDFTGNERTVELSGEGWFEVAGNKQKPFRLKMKGMTIEVLGTHFNVHAYDDEINKTTLLSGNIRVKTDSGQWLTVKPNQQVWLDSARHLQITPADPYEIKQAIAWKTDSIFSENASLKEIMLQLGRWYDATITDSASVGNKKVMMKPLSRNGNISTILDNLKNTYILDYRIEGRTVTLLAPLNPPPTGYRPNDAHKRMDSMSH